MSIILGDYSLAPQTAISTPRKGAATVRMNKKQVLRFMWEQGESRMKECRFLTFLSVESVFLTNIDGVRTSSLLFVTTLWTWKQTPLGKLEDCMHSSQHISHALLTWSNIHLMAGCFCLPPSHTDPIIRTSGRGQVLLGFTCLWILSQSHCPPGATGRPRNAAFIPVCVLELLVGEKPSSHTRLPKRMIRKHQWANHQYPFHVWYD